MRGKRWVSVSRVAVAIVGAVLLAAGPAWAVVIQAGKPAGSAADQALFKKVKAYLQRQLKDCQDCKLVLVIQNGHVRLSGVTTGGSLPHLRELKQAVPGIASVNLDQLTFDPEPHP